MRTEEIITLLFGIEDDNLDPINKSKTLNSR